MKKGLIGLLGAALLVGTLVVIISFCSSGPLMFTYSEGEQLAPGSPLSPWFQLAVRLWGWHALPYITMYVCILASCVGVALLNIALDERYREPIAEIGRRVYVLFISIVIAVVIANVSGWAFPPQNPCSGSLGCRPYVPPIFRPPVWIWVQTYPILSLALLMGSVLAAMFGIYLTRVKQGELRVLVARMLQILPMMIVTAIGLVALFLFSYPYNP